MKTMIKKISAILLTVLIMIPVLCLSASAAVGNNIDDILFDWQYYYNKYPDLQRAFGTNQTALRNHYNNYGKAEGRSPSALFDPQVYVGLYPDLKNAMGYNYTALYNHFKNNGIKEGRQGSAYFSVEVYKSNYADLRNAFGTSGDNNWKYLQHWRNHGQGEGRNATTKIANGGSSGGSASTTTYYVKTSGASLNVRSGASTSYSTIGQLANGASVQVYSISNGWAKIKYNNTTGYVSSDYLTNARPDTSNTSAASSPISARLQAMMDGSYGNSAYKLDTKYTGAYSNEQCKGFAKRIHEILFDYNIGSTKGKPDNYQISINSKNSQLVGSLTSLSSKSDSSLRDIFAKARPGDFIQVRRSHGGSHSMIFLSADSTSVTVYECNVDGNNGIIKATYQYSKFRSDNTAVSVYTAKNYSLH